MEKRGRVMDANESFEVLQKTPAGRATLISWFDPFYAQMVDAIEKGKKSTILGGTDFNIRVCENGTDFVFKKSDDFIPMTRLSLDRLRYLVEMNNAVTTS